MKRWLVFVLGVLIGIVLTILFAIFFSSGVKMNDEGEEKEQIDGVTLFDEPGDIIDLKSFKVFQVIAKDAALVHGKENDKYDLYMGAVYVLINDEGKYYYDDEIVNVPKDKVVRQLGIYQYTTKSEREKTVPIIRIMDK